MQEELINRIFEIAKRESQNSELVSKILDVAKNEKISPNGLKPYEGGEIDIRESWLNYGIASLIGEIIICLHYINMCKYRKSINREITSYGMKHILQSRAKTYISNGSMLIALYIHPEIYVKRIYNSPNAFTNISRSSILSKWPGENLQTGESL